MIKKTYEIILWHYWEDKPQYIIFKTVYFFGFSLFGEILREDTPFESLEEAEEYLKTINK